MPGTLGDNTITHTTFASSSISDDAESTLFYDYIIDTADLVVGLNTIAVEIHQNVGNSSDLSFDLELVTHAGQAFQGQTDLRVRRLCRPLQGHQCF